MDFSIFSTKVCEKIRSSPDSEGSNPTALGQGVAYLLYS